MIRSLGNRIFQPWFAAQMRNFVYCVADPTTREALIIDAAWDVDGAEESEGAALEEPTEEGEDRR